MRVRQSDLKLWAKCPLMWRFQNVDRAPREQSGSLTFGSLIHFAVLLLEKTQDVEYAVDWFTKAWHQPELVDPEYEPSYYVRGTSFHKYAKEGPRIIRRWWEVIQFERDVVLAREYHFIVPIGDHELEGTIDKLAVRYEGGTDEDVILVSDYKTTKKEPTYGYLAHDLQFTAYCYATTRPEFWEGLDEGAKLYQDARLLKRMGEWVSLVDARRKSAGERTEMHYRRLEYAVNAFADSVAMGIYVPNISGESCLFCDYRNHCGLPSREEEQELFLGTATERGF